MVFWGFFESLGFPVTLFMVGLGFDSVMTFVIISVSAFLGLGYFVNVRL